MKGRPWGTTAFLPYQSRSLGGRPVFFLARGGKERLPRRRHPPWPPLRKGGIERNENTRLAAARTVQPM